MFCVSAWMVLKRSISYELKIMKYLVEREDGVPVHLLNNIFLHFCNSHGCVFYKHVHMFLSRNIVPCAKPFFCLFLWPTIIPRDPSIGGSRSTNQRIATVVSSKPQPCPAQVFTLVATRWLMDLDRRRYLKCLWSRILHRSCRESWSCNFRIAFLEKFWKNWALTLRRLGDISY